MPVPRLRTITSVASIGVLVGAVYYQDPRSSIHDYLLLPLARKVWPDAEDSHRAAIKFMRYPYLNPSVPSRWLEHIDPEQKLGVDVFTGTKNPRVRSLHLPTPVGVAAGLDKNGEAIDTLFQLGFSWVEVGSVTPEPQPGNPRPRVFRLLEDGAIVNRYGFNSDGHAAVLAKLEIRKQRQLAQNHNQPVEPRGVLAVNLGKNKTGDEVQDYVKGVRAFGPIADALVVNVSSPNTPGLRDLQQDTKLKQLLTTLVSTRNELPGSSIPPLLVKIAPDLSGDEIQLIGKAVKESGIDGVVVGNTTIGRPSTLTGVDKLQKGGLSGKPLKPITLDVLRLLRCEVGPDITIVGCGGISSGKDAVEYAKAGADFVQIYTSFAYGGVGKPALLTEDISKALQGASWTSLQQK